MKPIRLRVLLPILLAWPAAAVQQGPCPATAGHLDRGARLERDRETLEEQLEALRRFGGQDAWAARLAELAEGRGPVDWIPTADGQISMRDVETALWFDRPAGAGRPAPGVDFERPEHPIHAILDLRDQLARAGVDLLLVPIPARAQLEAHLLLDLGSREGFRGMAQGSTQLNLELARRGVEVLDPLPTLLERQRGLGGEEPGRVHLRHDPHWSPLGCALTAERVAERLAEYEWFEPRDVREGTHFTLHARTARIRPHWTLAGQVSDREEIPMVCVRPVDVDRDRPRDRESPILLLGDSHSTIFDAWSADFVRHLWRLSRHPLDAICIVDGAPLMTRKALARREDPLGGKKLVIWLFSVRELRKEERWGKVRILPE